MKLRNSNGILAVLGGFLFASVFMGLEKLAENPAATHSISIFHFPLIWLMAGLLLYTVLAAVGIARAGEVKTRLAAFSLNVIGSALIALFWLFPMVSSLIGCFGGSGC